MEYKELTKRLSTVMSSITVFEQSFLGVQLRFSVLREISKKKKKKTKNSDPNSNGFAMNDFFSKRRYDRTIYNFKGIL